MLFALVFLRAANTFRAELAPFIHAEITVRKNVGTINSPPTPRHIRANFYQFFYSDHHTSFLIVFENGELVYS